MPEAPFQLRARLWRSRLSWRLLATFWATGLAGGGLAWPSRINTLVMVIEVLGGISLYALVVYRIWRARVVLTITSSGASTVVAKGWFADRRVPVDQIMEVSDNPRHGPEIHTIDGRKIGFLPLAGGLTRKSWARADEMVETLNRAARAARAAHPEEAAAAVEANAPLRARREWHRFLGWAVLGLGMVLLGLTPPLRLYIVPLEGYGGFFLVLGLGLLYHELCLSKGRGKHSRH
jgi:hypothetical protein